MNDKLILSQCHFSCRIGCQSEEKILPRTIIIDLELFFDTKKSGLSDDLKDTVDYMPVHTGVKNLVEGKPYNLIEGMAEEVAQFILANFPVQKVMVRVQKPEPIRQYGGAWVGVEITRP
ncbi:MAG: dihydroneopterin aldolase [Candidatus Magasanikbacteria bacterium]|nr:dihydroneopterin aldolase [Candidatus Magasanikbacteria bacterium]